MKKLWLGMIPLLALGRLNTARAEKATADERAGIRTQFAAEYFKRRQFGVAIEEAQKAIAINPAYAPAYGMLALVYMDLQEDAKARDNFNHAVEYAPNDPDIRHNYGYFLCDRGQYQAGVAEYMAALRNPTYQMPVKTLIAAGICSEKGGRDEDARAHYERALRFQPDDVTARYRLASLLLKQGQLPQARIHALELARQKDPRSDVLWLALRIERMLGNTEAERNYAGLLRSKHGQSLETSKLLAGQYD